MHILTVFFRVDASDIVKELSHIYRIVTFQCSLGT